TIATSTSFRLNVAHGIPSAGMKHRGLGGTTRFSVGFDGTVRLDFNPARFVSAHFYAAYEAEDDRYRLTYRHAF
ncbi:MAG: hypothetical protein GTO30_21465, partial [Acidobacteria bacterium]|nr:hypothetical protein [Acidobacteriota bacterium]NIQ87237.1 hypothetical protein [Acidobacteriota bacterium]